MTTHKDTASIIERLEAASGPDDALDHDIGMLVGFGGSFSSSIDSALSLVPEGWEVFIASGDPTCNAFQIKTPNARIQPHMKNDEAWRAFSQMPERERVSYGKSPAIALCIAALRARSNKGEG